MVVHCHFVLPRLSQVQPGRYPVLTVSRGRPSAGSGVFLHLCYEPFAERFLVAADIGCPGGDPHPLGGRGGDMQVLELEGAGATSTTGRVLRAVVLIARTGVFPSIVDIATADLDWDFGAEESMHDMLLGLAEQFDVFSGGSKWARRARSLAEETEQLYT